MTPHDTTRRVARYRAPPIHLIQSPHDDSFVWAPRTQTEYETLSPARRFMERVCRSGWAPGIYDMVEIWWHRMVGRDKSSNAERPVFSRD